jgi:MFS family permease
VPQPQHEGRRRHPHRGLQHHRVEVEQGAGRRDERSEHLALAAHEEGRAGVAVRQRLLQYLSDLKVLVDTGVVRPTPEQTRLLDALAGFDAARAWGLSAVTSIGVLATLVVLPVIGLLSDRTRTRWGRRTPWIAVGTVAGALLLIAQRQAATLAWLIVLWSLAQLAVNAAQAPLLATIADRVPSARLGTRSSVSWLGSAVGSLFGSLAAAALLVRIGLDSY